MNDTGGNGDGGRLAKSSPGAIASLSATIFLSSLGGSAANVGLPTLSRTFGISFPQAQWIVIAYFLAVISLIINAGRLADSVGRQRLQFQRWVGRLSPSGRLGHPPFER